jgi:hypothetical protein
MARMTDDELRKLFKEGVNALYRLDRENPTAWAEAVQGLEQIESDHPELDDYERVARFLTPFFVEKIQQFGKPVRYPADYYDILLTKFTLLFEKPSLAAFAACDLLDACTDPTERVEDCIRFAEVNLGAKFERISDDEAFEKQFALAKSIAAAEGNPIRNEERVRKQFRRTYELAKSMKRSGMTRTELIDYVCSEFLRGLSLRGLKTRPDEWYKIAIQFIMSISIDAEQTAIGIIMMATAPDPTRQLEEAHAYATRCIES